MCMDRICPSFDILPYISSAVYYFLSIYLCLIHTPGNACFATYKEKREKKAKEKGKNNFWLTQIPSFLQADYWKPNKE